MYMSVSYHTCKGSAWVPAFAGTHASVRAGKELKWFHPTQTKIEIERNAKGFIRKEQFGRCAVHQYIEMIEK